MATDVGIKDHRINTDKNLQAMYMGVLNNMGFKKQSVIFLMMFTFGWFYVVFLFVDFFITADEEWKKFDHSRGELIQPYLEMGTGFIKQGDLERAALYTEKAIDENLLDYYYITEGDKLKYFYSKKLEDFGQVSVFSLNQKNKQIIDPQSFWNLIIHDDYSYASSKVGDKVLTIGLLTTPFRYFFLTIS